MIDESRIPDVVARDTRPAGQPARASLQQRYEAWRGTENGLAIVAAVTEAALRLRERGFRHYGMKALMEAARYTYALRVGPDAEGFKVNNNWGSRLARDLMVEHESLQGMFELRELKAVGDPIENYPDNPRPVNHPAAQPPPVVRDAPEYVARCGRCRKPFAETREFQPKKGQKPPEGVREGKCEVHGWQSYPI